VKLTSYGEVLEDKLVNQELEAGLLLEFKKDADRVLLAVVHRRDGKKNWMVFDQVSIKTYYSFTCSSVGGVFADC